MQVIFFPENQAWGHEYLVCNLNRNNRNEKVNRVRIDITDFDVCVCFISCQDYQIKRYIKSYKRYAESNY